MFGRNPVKKSSPDQTYLTLDIGTEFIKSVLFRVENGEVKVIGYDRAPQKHNAMHGALIINLSNVIDVVDVSIGNTMNMAREITGADVPLPSKAVLGIAGELVKGVVIEVGVEREDPDEQISRQEVDDIVRQIKAQAFGDAKAEITQETGIATDQIVEIESSVNSVYIDGHKVDSPLGMKGKDITYKVFSTFAPKLHVESIKEVAKKLNLDVQRVVVQPYALAMGMKNARSERFSGIFIDIGGGTTDIALVQDGALVGTKMFAFGGRVFTKRIEADLNIDYKIAEQMKIDYSDQKLPSGDAKQVAAAIQKDIQIWIGGVEIALAEFTEIGSYPGQIYLCGGGALLPEIQDALVKHPWLQVLPFTKFPKVTYLFPNQIVDVLDLTKKATHPLDVTPLALSRMVLDQLDN
jgi:cell division protein FtsA